MTDELAPEQVEEARLQQGTDIAGQLLLLAMLKYRVGEREDELRARLARIGRPKDVFEELLPNADDPEKPLEAGRVRVDDGAVTVRVTDAAAFEAWVGKHHRASLIRQPAGTTARPAPLPEELEALHAALLAAQAALADPWAEPLPDMWRGLVAAGYQLAKIEPVPARTIVDPVFMEGLTKVQKDHAKLAAAGEIEATDSDGLVVDGLTVTKGAPKVVVLPSHDDLLVDLYACTKTGRSLLVLDNPEEAP